VTLATNFGELHLHTSAMDLGPLRILLADVFVRLRRQDPRWRPIFAPELAAGLSPANGATCRNVFTTYWKTMKKALLALAALALTGCTTANNNPLTQASANAKVVCENASHCERLWEFAQVWVAQTSGYKMRTITNNIIWTEGPLVQRVELAYEITKVPAGDGKYEIVVAAGCGNLFGCRPDRVTAITELTDRLRVIAP
jgi:hypothetical protein